MDLWTIVGVVMLVAWAVATFTTHAPGWVHGLLTAGVFLVIWRMVVRGTPDVALAEEEEAPAAPGRPHPASRAGGDRAPRG